MRGSPPIVLGPHLARRVLFEPSAVTVLVVSVLGDIPVNNAPAVAPGADLRREEVERALLRPDAEGRGVRAVLAHRRESALASAPLHERDAGRVFGDAARVGEKP